MPLIGIYIKHCRFLRQDSFLVCVGGGYNRNFVRGIYTSGLCQKTCIQIKTIVIQSSLILSALQTKRNKLNCFQLVSDVSFEGPVPLKFCHIKILRYTFPDDIFFRFFCSDPRELQLLDTAPILISKNEQQVLVKI